MISPEKFAEQVTGWVWDSIRKRLSSEITKHGYIDSAYASGLPRVRWDGESQVTGRTYPYLASYAPAAGDRIAAIRSGRTWLIIGKIVRT